MSFVIQFSGVFKSEFSRVVASASVSGKANGTSAQLVVWQRWPKPTVGKPMGSGEGLATNPSNCLMRLTVAALTAGAAQLDPDKQQRNVLGPGQSPSSH